MADADERRGYHHGDARNALIAAAGALLEAQGAAGLSLRQAAERAGLSRQAPYNHFADKEALLAALALDGFERLERELRAAAADRTGITALAASGEAYVAFAQGSPALFRLMFSRELVDLKRFPDAAAAAARAFAALADVIASLTPDASREELSLAAWSIVHGYATLCNEAGIEEPERRGGRAALFARILGAAAREGMEGADEDRAGRG